MTPAPVVTRFAPSPSGELHLGNVRTALHSWLLARRTGGRFLLRIEDTDAARSSDAHVAALLEDLRWLGLDWDGGPGAAPRAGGDGKVGGAASGAQEGEGGPWRQSERAGVYAPLLARLEREDRAYPCYCSNDELQLVRAAQRAAGQPPRYAGTCARLDAAGRAARAARGLRPSLRFRVPAGGVVAFDDLVHGAQSFECALIGDFVVRRDDGTPAFFFANAVDDALMGVTLVLRGEDHLANTPRQLLLLEALGLRPPAYGHEALITGSDGAPLSKRNGAQSLRELREAGYSPAALLNLLLRLGHSTPLNGLLPLARMPAAFDPGHLQRASARFDPVQLTHWQSQWVHGLDVVAAEDWLAPAMPAALSGEQRTRFVAAVRANVLLAPDVRSWLPVVIGGPLPMEEPARAAIHAAGEAFFAAALAATDAALAAGEAPRLEALRAATGRKGAQFYAPLRAALTGRMHGPELAPLLAAIPTDLLRRRLAGALES
jgi:glutamyl-tRNA synthetase